MSSFRRHFGAMLGVLLLAVLSGCVSLSVVRPSGPWHEAYEPITDSESTAFVNRALARARQVLGEPVIPVKKVLIRRSQKTESARRYRIAEDFSLTQCVDPKEGVFAIYIGVDTNHPNFFPLLGHEVVHLLHPYITDWYMEGIATLFSEQFCAEEQREWGRWRRHFNRSRRDPYALSYRMATELQASFPEEYPLLWRYTAPNRTRKGWHRIDIDRWLATLRDDERVEALDIIALYVKNLRRKVSPQYDFAVPAELR